MNEFELINSFDDFYDNRIKQHEYAENAIYLCDLMHHMINLIDDDDITRAIIEWLNFLQINANNLKSLEKKSRTTNTASIKEEIKEKVEAIQSTFTDFRYSNIYKRFKATTKEVSTTEDPSARPQESRVQYQDIGIFDKLAESASRYRMVIKVDIQTQEAYLIPHDENIDRHEQAENNSTHLRIVNERD